MTKTLKAASRLNKEEALKELKKLAEVVDFEEEFSEETKLEDLRRLVKEGREAAAEDDDDEDESDDEESDDESDDEDESDEEDSDESDDDEDDVDDDEEDEESAPAVVESGAPKGKGVHVFAGNGKYIRSFTPKKHGKKFAAIAKQFVSKKGRENFTTKEVK